MYKLIKYNSFLVLKLRKIKSKCKMSSSELKPINVKLAMIGSYSIGKSTLIQRWRYGQFMGNISPTIGAAYITKDVKINNIPIKCHVWDTAGGEKYRSLISIYLRDSNVIIVCFSIIDINNIQKWIDDALDTNSDARIFLALTKYDDKNKDKPKDIIEIELFAKENGYDFFKTSSITGEGVEELFTEATKTACINRKEPSQPKIVINKEEENTGCCILL